MANSKKLRYSRISSRVLFLRNCISPSINIRSITGEQFSISGELYVVSNLLCDIIIGIDLIKTKDINFRWGE